MTNPLDDPAVVAVLKYPISVSKLELLSAALQEIYGPDLWIEPGNQMVIRLPEGRTEW